MGGDVEGSRGILARENEQRRRARRAAASGWESLRVFVPGVVRIPEHIQSKHKKRRRVPRPSKISTGPIEISQFEQQKSKYQEEASKTQTVRRSGRLQTPAEAAEASQGKTEPRGPYCTAEDRGQRGIQPTAYEPGGRQVKHGVGRTRRQDAQPGEARIQPAVTVPQALHLNRASIVRVIQQGSCIGMDQLAQLYADDASDGPARRNVVRDYVSRPHGEYVALPPISERYSGDITEGWIQQSVDVGCLSKRVTYTYPSDLLWLSARARSAQAQKRRMLKMMVTANPRLPLRRKVPTDETVLRAASEGLPPML